MKKAGRLSATGRFSTASYYRCRGIPGCQLKDSPPYLSITFGMLYLLS